MPPRFPGFIFLFVLFVLATSLQAEIVPDGGYAIEKKQDFPPDFLSSDDLTLWISFTSDSDPMSIGGLLSWINQNKTGKLQGIFAGVLKFDTFRLLGVLIDRMPDKKPIFLAAPLWSLEPRKEEGRHNLVLRLRNQTHGELILDGQVVDKRITPSHAYTGDIGRFFSNDRFFGLDFGKPILQIGSDPTGRVPFRGKVHEVMFWPRALSDDEIAKVSGKSFDLAWTKPVGWNVLSVFPTSMSYEERSQWLDAALETRLTELVHSDASFPSYHPAVPFYSCNHNVFYYEGRYHLFPVFDAGWWGTMNIMDKWGVAHLVSEDLVHWRLEKQVRKLPSRNTSIVAADDGALIFLGLGPESFEAYDANSGPAKRKPAQFHVLHSRDPILRDWNLWSGSPLQLPKSVLENVTDSIDCDVFKDNGYWYMIVSDTSSTKPNTLYLCRSTDLRSWEYAGVFYQGESPHSPEIVHFFPLEGKWVLASCQRLGPDYNYVVGRFENGKFLPENKGIFDAGQETLKNTATVVWTTSDKTGRRLLWQWLHGLPPGPWEERLSRWSTAYSLPRVVTLAPDGKLAFEPADEIKTLRDKKTELPPGVLKDGELNTLKNVSGKAIELQVKIVPKTSQQCGLLFDDGERKAELVYSTSAGTLSLKTLGKQPVMMGPNATTSCIAPLTLSHDEALEARVFVDGRILEVYFNGKRCMTGMWEPADASRIQVSAFARGGNAEIKSAEAWTLKSAWASHTEKAPSFDGLKGDVSEFSEGVQLFSNRSFKALQLPEELVGLKFIRTPIDFAQTILCTRAGVVYAVTPTGTNHSLASYLLQIGFEKVPIPPFQLFGTNPVDQVYVFRKSITKGDTLRIKKWALLLGSKDLSLNVVSTAKPWSQNDGEILYNGIVLPQTWPPIHMDSSNPDSMPVPYLKSPPKIIRIDVGRQLFVDDFLIQNTDLKRTFYAAQKYAGNPVFKAEREGERGPPIANVEGKGTTFLGHGGVFWDPKDDVFKMFYTAGWRGGLALATSKDLIHWIRPDLGIAAGNLLLPQGSQWNGPKLTTAGSDNAVWLDLSAKNPAERIKYITCWIHADKVPEDFHHTLHTSADGRTWSDAIPVKPAADDYSSFFYNPFRKVWVFSMKSGGPNGRNRNYFESKEFLQGGDQSKIVYWTGADKLDLPEPQGGYPGAGDKPQLYSLGGVAYESIMVGMHYIHRGPDNAICAELKIPKLVDLELGFSRDGFHWDRPDRHGFIKGSRKEGSWDRAYIHSTTGIFVVMGDKLVFPYMGTSGVATDGSRAPYSGGSIGLAMIRRDGFASMDADSKGGTLTTRPVTFSGKDLFINAQVPQGSLVAEVCDVDGKPIAPFTFENSLPFTGDSTLAQMKWKDVDGLSRLAGKAVRFHFKLNNGSLYSFWVSKDDSGRSDGYLGAGGPGYLGVIDTIGRSALEALPKKWP